MSNLPRILITDDDPTSLEVLKWLAESVNFEPMTATSVASARKILTQCIPHFAILDVLLPDGDGIDILLDIRRAKLPTAVALVTATLAEFPFHKCGGFMPDTLLAKPLDPTGTQAWIAKELPAVNARMQTYRPKAA